MSDDNDFAVAVTWEDREQQVLDLFEQGKRRRDIAKICRMNFTDIKKIVDSKYGAKQNKNKSKSEISGYQQALKLFLGGAKPVEVAIKLQLTFEEVRKIYIQFLGLNRMYRLKQVFNNLGNGIKPFLTLFDKMQKNNFTVDQITEAVNFAGSLPELEEKHSTLINDIQNIEQGIQRSTSLAQELESQIEDAKSRLNYYNYLCEMKKKEIAALNFTINRNNAF
jgi:hypothetical protein